MSETEWVEGMSIGDNLLDLFKQQEPGRKILEFGSGDGTVKLADMKHKVYSI